MRPRRQNPQAAFTLVELMIGAALSAALMAAVLSTYIYLGRGLARLANQQTLENEARRTLGYFTQDVQSASGITDTSNLSATRVSLLVPASGGTNTVTYYFNNTASSTTVSVNGTNISMAANALTRCVYNGSTVASLVLLRNITSGGLTLKYYDSAGRPYTTYVNYLPGITQMALQFNTQLGNSTNGTRTQIYPVSSSRIVMRNDKFLQ
jgi:Tfp pilus assembly protein PilW